MEMGTVLELFCGSVGALSLFILKGIKDDVGSMRQEMKELRDEVKNHGNRLTAIETGLKMFEWFHVTSDHKEKTPQGK